MISEYRILNDYDEIVYASWGTAPTSILFYKKS